MRFIFMAATLFALPAMAGPNDMAVATPYEKLSSDNLQINSDPVGVTAIATIRYLGKDHVETCQTPCALRIPRMYAFSLRLTKEGYGGVPGSVVVQRDARGFFTAPINAKFVKVAPPPMPHPDTQ